MSQDAGFENRIKTRPARSFYEFFNASRLVHDLYSASGYMKKCPGGLRLFLRDILAPSTLLVSLLDKQVIGTSTMTYGGDVSFPSGNLFENEILRLLSQNRNVAESTKFACIAAKLGIPKTRGKPSVIANQILKLLFQWCVAKDIHDWLIVIHPKHSRFYLETLGFDLLSTEKDCNHVGGNPGVLLRLDIDSIRKGTRSVTPASKELFLKSPTLPTKLVESYRIKSEEVAFLLLGMPELLALAEKQDIVFLQSTYPNVAETLSRVTKESRHTWNGFDLPFLATFQSYFQLAKETIQDFAPQVIQLRNMLNRIVGVLDLAASNHIVQIACEVDDKVPDSIVTDPVLLGQLIEEAVRSATESNQPNSSVNIRINSQEDDAKEMSLLVTIESMLSRIPTGCRNITNSMGGNLWMKELTPNTSLMRFSIPALVFEDSVAAVIKHEDSNSFAEANMLAGQQVLIVDDNRVTQKLLKRLLEKQGCRVDIASNGKNALNILKRKLFDLVLMDCQMPVMNGFEATKLIRTSAHPLNRAIPVVALTALVMEGDRERCLRAGMNEYVAKPVSTTHLLQTLHRLTYKESADVKRRKIG